MHLVICSRRAHSITGLFAHGYPSSQTGLCTHANKQTRTHNLFHPALRLEEQLAVADVLL
jgi:hypothetical protein